MNADILVMVIALGVGVTVLALGMNHRDAKCEEKELPPEPTPTREPKTIVVDGVTYYSTPTPFTYTTHTRRKARNPFWKILATAFTVAVVAEWALLITRWNRIVEYSPDTPLPNLIHPAVLIDIAMNTLVFSVILAVLYLMYRGIRAVFTRPEPTTEEPYTHPLQRNWDEINKPEEHTSETNY